MPASRARWSTRAATSRACARRSGRPDTDLASMSSSALDRSRQQPVVSTRAGSVLG
jgi:hypothetical protein